MLLIAARAAAASKDLATAESHLRRAVQIDSALLTGYVMLGQLYVAQGKLMEAKREFDTIAQRQAKPISALTMLGMISQMQGDGAGAERYFAQVVDLDPRAPIAANNLAWIYAERGEQLDRALQLALGAAEAQPRVPEIQDTLGWVYYKRQMPEQATRAFRESVNLDPRNPTYHYHLGLARVQAGEPALARQSLQRALELGNFPAAAQARRLLDELPAPGTAAR